MQLAMAMWKNGMHVFEFVSVMCVCVRARVCVKIGHVYHMQLRHRCNCKAIILNARVHFDFHAITQSKICH